MVAHMPRIGWDLSDEGPFRLSKDEMRCAKKTDEEAELGYFLNAYYGALGEALQVSDVRTLMERPDFICVGSNRSLLGLELTKVVRGDPEWRWADSVLFHRDHMHPVEALQRVYDRIGVKESKRQDPDWQLRDDTILVIQIMDCSLRQFQSQLEPPPDPHGFKEIWLADYSELGAYHNIEIFALHPAHLWGHYPSNRGKPYG